jgi:transcriptional regulator with XRE-family HTH domain
MSPSEAVRALLEGGLSESAIAARCGVNQSSVNRIKRGAVPNYDVGRQLVALARKEKRRVAQRERAGG